jgi:hypothetical protein
MISRAAKMPHKSKLEYPHPLRSAMQRNFSWSLGDLHGHNYTKTDDGMRDYIKNTIF